MGCSLERKLLVENHLQVLESDLLEAHFVTHTSLFESCHNASYHGVRRSLFLLKSSKSTG